MQIGVVIYEDNDNLRESLCNLVLYADNLLLLGNFSRAGEADKQIITLQPDVVLMDIDMPGVNGIEAVKRIRAFNQQVQIIMLTVFENSDVIFQSLAAGASGYLLKQTPPAKLLEAIQDVYQGGSPMSGEIARKVVQSFQHPLLSGHHFVGLTKREEEILSYLAKGYLYKEIASLLFISVETVRTHLRNIYEKLQVRTRTEAILKYLNK